MSEDATEEQESTALVIIYPRGETAYRDFALEVVSLVDTADQIVVNNPADSKVATDHLGAIADRKKVIEAFRTELLVPLRLRTTLINEAVKELTDRLVAADQYLRGRVLAYNADVRAEVARKEDIIRKEKELAALKDEPAPEPVPTPAPAPALTRGEHTQSGERMVTKYEVVDFAALSDDYKLQDTGKLTKAVKAGGMAISIPGVRIFQEAVLAIGRA